MRYLTCDSCRFDPAECGRRQDVAQSVATFNRVVGAESQLTAIRFLCPDRFIGYELGRRVEVLESVVHDTREGGTYSTWDVILGWIVQQKGDRVRIFLDDETSRGKRLIWLRPMPPRSGDTIGVRPRAQRVDPEEARRLMVREIRRARGEAGDDDFWCPGCESWFGMAEARYKGGGLDVFCPKCDERPLTAEGAVELSAGGDDRPF